MHRLPLLALAVVLAACGGSKHAGGNTIARGTKAPPPGDILYEGASSAVTVSGTRATAYHLLGGKWIADRSGDPKLGVLGPKPGQTVAATPQLAFQVEAKSDILDTAMWVDGVEVLGKGGGLTPRRGTVYGSPDRPLKAGGHLAVAYARDAKHANAVAWSFKTP